MTRVEATFFCQLRALIALFYVFVIYDLNISKKKTRFIIL